MMKLQTKTSSLTLKIQKLAKGLNKFTINDISQIIPQSEDEIISSLAELEKNSVIKKISDTEYLYIKLNKLADKINSSIDTFIPDMCWLTIEEVSNLTGQKRETIRRKCKSNKYICKFEYKGKYKEYKILKRSIDEDLSKLQVSEFKQQYFKYKELKRIEVPDKNIFKSEEEQQFFDTFTEWQKKYVMKYLTAFKTAGKFRGKALRIILDKFKQETGCKISYSTYMQRLNKYLVDGIEALIPRYACQKSKNQAFIPDDMYEEFKKIYLSSDKCSMARALRILADKGFDELTIPSGRSFHRKLHQEFDAETISALRRPVLNIPDISYSTLEVQKENKKIKEYEYFIDGANDYLNLIKNSKTTKDECARGYIKNHLIPFFKEYKFRDISSETLADFQAEKMAQGFTAGSIERYLTVLSGIFTKYANVKNNIVFSAKNVLSNFKRRSYLSPEQVKEYINAKSPELWILCLGLNPAELAALKYSDIDFKNKTVTINKFLYKGEIQKHRALYKIRTLRIYNILLNCFNKKTGYEIFTDINIDNFDELLNTHVKLLLDKNITLNIISKNLGYKCLDDFKARFNFLLPQKLDDGFEIFGG